MRRTRHRSGFCFRFRAENFCKPGTFDTRNRLRCRFRREQIPRDSKSLIAVTEWRKTVTVSIGHLQPIVALVAGVLILIMPRLLNYIVALYLILVGILGLGIIK
jgi:hypothetical protein